MKIIFLDIDGVLNSQNWYEYRYENIDMKLVSDNYPDYEIDPGAIKQLNRIIAETEAKVVISSTWRHGRTIQELQTLLEKCGFVGEIISITPSLHFNTDVGMSVPRGCEIEKWLKDQGFQRINWSISVQQEYLDKSKVKNYVILDDDGDMQYGQREHFIWTPTKEGLTQEHADKAIAILNQSLMDLYYK